MLGYRKKSFDAAFKLLRHLEDNLADVDTLTALQKLLLREIVRAEQQIRQLKAELKSVEGADSAKGRKSAYLSRRIEGLRQTAFVWRCFGDAIAFLYVDKYALKQTYYSTENLNAKQDAGFIAGKSGLAGEIRLLESALAKGIPAVLADLTNTIRHGDVCLLANDDPVLVEVKSSAKLNPRGKKQGRSIEKLHNFFDTDVGHGLRGFPEVFRAVSAIPERCYIDEINVCITEALDRGWAIRCPEAGLHYVVLTNAPIDEVLGRIDAQRPWLFQLNEAKANRQWAPYSPFLLSIRNQDHVWKFIRGEIYIIVVVDMAALVSIASAHGFTAHFEAENENYPLRLVAESDGGQGGVSASMLDRMAMEFVSPEWIMLTTFEHWRKFAGTRSEKNEENRELFHKIFGLPQPQH